MINPAYEVFYRLFGTALHFYSNYWLRTEGNTKNQTVELINWIYVEAGKAEGGLHNMFRYMKADHQSGKLSNEAYRKYLKFYKLIIDDPSILANKIKQDKDIVQAVRELS